MTEIPDGGTAFPICGFTGDDFAVRTEGMSMRQWFAGQALSNPALCTGHAPDYDLRRWFGDRGGITGWQVAAAQAFEHADAMLKARKP